jgi:hypothetical protein
MALTEVAGAAFFHAELRVCGTDDPERVYFSVNVIST